MNFSSQLYFIISKLEKEYAVRSYPKINTFDLIFKFNDEIEFALEELKEILDKIDTKYGYKCFHMIGYDKIDRNLKNECEFNLSNFEKLICENYTKIRLTFKAKYDIEGNIPPIVFYFAPYIYRKKLKRFGLMPNYRSKNPCHPDRVYLSPGVLNYESICKDICEKSGNKITKFITFAIHTKDIGSYFKLFKDENFDKRGYYI